MKLLSQVNPELFSQLDPNKNTPAEMSRATSTDKRMYWWLGACDHSWEASVSNRAGSGTGCPFCAGQKILAGFNDLGTVHPTIAAQWHPTKNGSDTPTTTHQGSNKKVWWKCAHGHDWEAPVARRVRQGSGCPVCTNKTILTGFNDLGTTHPDIAAQWHPNKNGNNTPQTIGAGSNKKAWWVCDEGHSWESPTVHRTSKGSGCAVCSRRVVLAGYNDLGTTHPEVAAQWHPDKNGTMTPQDVLSGSGKKIWWQCSDGHDWEATLLSRTGQGNGCPVCSGQLVVPGVNDMLTKFPHLATEWHPTKNGTVNPSTLSPGVKEKAWWICVEGHEWEALIMNRTHANRGCPVCVNQKIVSGVNDLVSTHPDLVAEWDYELNVGLSPDSVSFGYKKNVWWKCLAGHPSWEASIRGRIRGYGCSYCVNRKVLAGYNDMASKDPALALLWHPTKNGDTDPSMVTPSTSKKFWWQCPQGHEWEKSPNGMKLDGAGKGCPQCSADAYVSGPEHKIAEHLRNLGLTVRQTVRDLVPRTEFDIYLPDHQVAIEFNGLFWHSEVFKVTDYHKTKMEKAQSVGVRLIQVWEDEWRNNPDMVLRMIEHKLGLSNQSKVYARKTQVVEVPLVEVREFFDAQHIQGFARGSHYLGLRDRDGQLVAAMVLRNEPGTNGKTLNIIRYATSHNVIGGFTKLMSWAEKTYRPDKFITFSDNCISDGGLYANTGFVAEEQLKPDYRYLVKGQRKHKFGYRLKKFRDDPALLWEEGKTESELAKMNRLWRIYDAGKVRWVRAVN